MATEQPQDVQNRLSETKLRTLANQLATSWEDLGIQLGIESYSLDEINYARPLNYKAFEMLKVWFQETEPRNQRECLIASLREAGRQDLSDYVEKELKRNEPSNKKQLSYLSNKLGNEWRKLGTYLKIPIDKMETICSNAVSPMSFSDCAQKMLVMWERQFDGNADEKNMELYAQLKKIKRVDLINQVGVEVQMVDDGMRNRCNDLDQVYKMTSNTRGRALIINNLKFSKARNNNVNLADRDGSDRDCDRLESLFNKLNFYVIIKRDKTAQEMEVLCDAERQNQLHKVYDAFVMVILSHGTDGGINGVDGKQVSVRTITNYFSETKCPDLMRKPKLFFIAACQITTSDSAMDQTDGLQPHQVPLSKFDEQEMVEADTPIEVKSDMLIAVPEYVSFRDRKGTLFIKHLVKVFAEDGCRMNIGEMMQKINDTYEQQMPVVWGTSFTKDLYFFPGAIEGVNPTPTKEEADLAEDGPLFGGNWKDKLYFDRAADSSIYIDKEDLVCSLEKSDLDEEIEEICGYKSSLICHRQLTQKILYHEFIVFKTKSRWWSVEKQKDAISIQRSETEEWVKTKFKRKDRKTPITIFPTRGKCIPIDTWNCRQFFAWVINEKDLHEKYHIRTSNCQQFAEKVYKKLCPT